MYRFAPSPTGDMHIGFESSLLINQLLTKNAISLFYDLNQKFLI
ncbi:glutamate--tRNA ligase family protein [Campylobacter jejuni]